MPAIRFLEFCNLCKAIENDSSHLAKTELVKAAVADIKSDPDQCLTLIRLLLPKQDQRVYRMQDNGICQLLSRIFSVSVDVLQDHCDSGGDVSRTAAHFFEASGYGQGNADSHHTIESAFQTLQKMDGVGKAAAQQHLLTEWIAGCRCSDELKYLLRLVKKDIKINAGNKVVLDGLGSGAYEQYQRKTDLKALISSLGKPQALLKTSSGTITLGTPVKPMLAGQCKGAAEALKKCGGGMLCEIKYDGERLQVHKQAGVFKFYSRNLKPVAKHKVENVENFLPKACPDGHNMVLDAEVILVDNNTGALLPFGSLGVHKKTGYTNASVCLFVFDILLLNDTCLVNTPLHERRKILEASLSPIPGNVVLSEKFDVTDEEGLNQLIAKVLADNHEGLVIKDVNGRYEPDKRRWLKIKKDYLQGMADSADLVVLGAYYGTGSKGGLMSVFLMGSYCESTQSWKTVCKVGNGHTDKVIDELQSLPMKKVSKNMSDMPGWLHVHANHAPDFVVHDPASAPVWEITGNGFVSDGHHTATQSIRFPRVTRVRSDKDATTHTNLKGLNTLVEASKHLCEDTIAATIAPKKNSSQPAKKPKLSVSTKAAPATKPVSGGKTQMKLSFMPKAKPASPAPAAAAAAAAESSSDDELEIEETPGAFRGKLIEFLDLVDPGRKGEVDQILASFKTSDEMFDSLQAEYQDKFAALTQDSNPKTAPTQKPCPYGSSCYRNNPGHREQYSHPSQPSAVKRAREEEVTEGPVATKKSKAHHDGDSSDDDYRSDVTDVLDGSDTDEPDVKPASAKLGDSTAPSAKPAKPICQYGTSCYRKNPQHFIDFAHPWM